MTQLYRRQVLLSESTANIQRSQGHHYPGSSQCGLNQVDCCLWVSHLYNQLIVVLVVQVNDDGSFGMMNIPKNSLAVLIKSSRRDHPGHIGSGQPDSVPPAARDLLRLLERPRYEQAVFRGCSSKPKACQRGLHTASAFLLRSITRPSHRSAGWVCDAIVSVLPQVCPATLKRPTPTPRQKACRCRHSRKGLFLEGTNAREQYSSAASHVRFRLCSEI